MARSQRLLVAGVSLGLAAASLVGLSAAPTAAAPEPKPNASDLAIRHVAAQPAEFGLTADDARQLRVSSVVPSPDGGPTYVYLQQQVGGIDVAEAIVNVVVGHGVVVHGASSGVKAAAARVNTDTPVVSDVRAARGAAEALDLAPTESFSAETKARGASRARELGDGGVSTDPIPANLVYQRTDDGSLRLAWQVVIDPTATDGWWQMRMDAATGEELQRIDWVAHAAEESYEAYELPVEAPTFGLRTVAANPADVLASPYGWLDTDGQPGADTTVTNGNNVHAYVDANDDNQPDPGSAADGGASHEFHFPLDLSASPATYRPAAVTNLFYLNNRIHDVLYHYGFTEAAGNFQANNYGRGGLGGDAVLAEAQDGAERTPTPQKTWRNNANFATPPDGQAPRMQMYLWTGNPMRDGDFDNGVIAHEYGHGVSNRLTGGPATTSCLQNGEQAGEGWSDFLGYLLTMPDGVEPVGGRGIGTYAMGQGIDGAGIRSQRYSTDPSVNTMRYDDIKTAFYNGSVSPHDVGEVWAQMLWELTWALIEKHGYDPELIGGDGGNNKALQLVMDGLRLQPCGPGFVDSRDAILAADRISTGGADSCLIWQAFAKHGLGYSARQGSSSLITDGTQAFDLPPVCEGLVLTTTPAAATVGPDRELGYALTLENTSVAALTGVRATAEVAPGAEYVAGSATCAGTYEAASRRVTFLVASLAAGATRSCTFAVRAAADSVSDLQLDESFETDLADWRAEALAEGSDGEGWVVADSRDREGRAAHMDVPGGASHHALTTREAIEVKAGAELHFTHRNDFEVLDAATAWDGGQVLVSTDGSSWTRLESQFTKNGPSHTAYAGVGQTAIGGQQVFAGARDGWVHSVADLSAWAGQSVYLRFQGVTDPWVGTDGWRVDDVQIGRPVAVRVTTTHSADGIAERSASVTTPVTAQAPAVVSAVTAEVASKTSARVSFLAGDDGGATPTYEAECTSGSGTVGASGSASPITVEGLVAGDRYRCRVRASQVAGFSDWSEPSPEHVQALAPSAATVASTRALSSSSARVAVSVPDDGGSPVTRIAVECRATGGATVSAQSASAPVTLQGLTPGRTYACRARASNAVGDGAFGAAGAGYLQAVAPTAPRVKSLKALAKKSLRVVVTPAANGGSAVTRYTATCVAPGGKTRKVAGAKPTLVVKKVTPGKKYRCRVSATNRVGTSALGPWSKKVRARKR